MDFFQLIFSAVDSACDVTQHADLAVVVVQEGLGHVCLITPSMTTVRAKVDVTIPRKRKGNVQQHEKVILGNLCSVVCCYMFYFLGDAQVF